MDRSGAGKRLDQLGTLDRSSSIESGPAGRIAGRPARIWPWERSVGRLPSQWCADPISDRSRSVMDSEIQLISDGDGLAVIGEPAAVERFLISEGLASKAVALPGLGAVLSAGAATAQGASEAAANSGRWVKLTKESAKLVKEHGLRENAKTGVRTGVVKGAKGQIKSFVEFSRAPGAVLTNPALLGAWVSSGIVGPEPNRLLTAGDLMAGSVWGCAWILWPCLRRGEDTAGIPGAVRPPPQARAGAPSGVVLRMVKSFMRLWQPASRSHSFWAWSRPRRSTRFPCRVWICPNTGSTIALRLA